MFPLFRHHFQSPTRLAIRVIFRPHPFPVRAVALLFPRGFYFKLVFLIQEWKLGANYIAKKLRPVGQKILPTTRPTTSHCKRRITFYVIDLK